eukprot:3131029-Alexandrium_andersonii.AAC.1
MPRLRGVADHTHLPREWEGHGPPKTRRRDLTCAGTKGGRAMEAKGALGSPNSRGRICLSTKMQNRFGQ